MHGYSVYTVTPFVSSRLKIFLELCNNIIYLMTNRTGIWQLLAYSVIVGDGNCLFRAISFSLFGHQDNHLQLRNMAVETLRGNIDIFRDYFIDGPGTAEEQIDHFGQPSTYAGQEWIITLTMALNRNIMVTVGGDLNNRVATYKNSFTSDQAHSHIHIIWRRAGGGHSQQRKKKGTPKKAPIKRPTADDIKKPPTVSIYSYNL